MKIAALYVQKNGCYFGLPDVDPWDEARDARLYDGPHPVVAHPPCASWCQLASVNEARWGARIGDDGGCFEAALECVYLFGGVLEHPAYTLAWNAHRLPRPERGSWQKALFYANTWVTEVSQSAYGHQARKCTWLLYVGKTPPPLDWSDPDGEAIIGDAVGPDHKPRLGKKEANATPLPFRDLLIDLARNSVRV